MVHQQTTTTMMLTLMIMIMHRCYMLDVPEKSTAIFFWRLALSQHRVFDTSAISSDCQYPLNQIGFMVLSSEVCGGTHCPWLCCLCHRHEPPFESGCVIRLLLSKLTASSHGKELLDKILGSLHRMKMAYLVEAFCRVTLFMWELISLERTLE